MQVPSFITWATGQVVTAAQMNSQIRDPGNFWLAVPVFEGVQTVSQSLTSGTGAGILLDTEIVDNDNGHSTSTNTDRYTPQTQGRFQCSGKVSFNGASGGIRNAEVWKNGAQSYNSVSIAPNGVLGLRVPAVTMTYFANGTSDFFQLAGFQSSGSPLSTVVAGAADQSVFSVRMVGTV